MNIGSHYSLHKGSAGVDKSRASARLDFRDLASGTIGKNADDDKDTLELSDGAKVHIAESIAGPDGVGDGTRYQRIVSFLRKAMEDSLGTKVGDINVDGLEVDSRTKTLRMKSASPTELPLDKGVRYETGKTNISLQENHIVVQGTVRTRDGKELQFDLGLDFVSATGSQSNASYRAIGDAAKDLPIMFDGVSRELTDTRFRFDSDPLSGLLAGKGTCCIREQDSESVKTGFRRYEWQA